MTDREWLSSDEAFRVIYSVVSKPYKLDGLLSRQIQMALVEASGKQKERPEGRSSASRA